MPETLRSATAPTSIISRPPLRGTLAVALLAPIAFLLAITAVAVVVGATQGGGDQVIARRVQELLPQVLLTTQLVLAALLFIAMRASKRSLADVGLSVKAPLARRLVPVGVAVGCVIGAAYVWKIAGLLDTVRTTVGDYVPPGEMLESYSTNLPVFFVANVLLAPVVEETLYRGFVLPRLAQRWGAITAIAVSSLAFGMLHWAGGLWYMVATAVFVGVPLAVLTLRAKSIVPAIAAHFALNAIEFAFVVVQSRG